MGKEGSRLGCIDGLRGIAVLLVLGEHVRDYWQIGTGQAMLGESGVWWIDWFHRIGQHGVDLFFVVSGFCLSRPLFDAVERNGSSAFDLPKYVGGRVSRILPPYLAALLLCSWYSLGAARFGYPRPLGLSGTPPTIPSILKQAILLDPTADLVQKAFWTLYVESRWYLIFPIVIWLFLRYARRPRVLGSLVGLVAVAYFIVDGDSAFLGALPSFLGGMAVGYAYGRDLHVRYDLPLCASLTVVALLATIGRYEQYQTFLWASAYVSIVLVTLRTRAIEIVVSSPPLRAVGVASYGLYLVDNVFGSNVAAGLHGRLPPPAIVLCSLLAALVGGFAFWFFVERPTQLARVRRSVTTFVAVALYRASRVVRVPSIILLKP